MKFILSADEGQQSLTNQFTKFDFQLKVFFIFGRLFISTRCKRALAEALFLVRPIIISLKKILKVWMLF
jgi:hypothetical protein